MPLGRGRVSFLDAALRKRRELIEERVIVAGFDLGGEILDLPDIGTTVRREAERPSGELLMNGIGKHRSSRVSLECQARANDRYSKRRSARRVSSQREISTCFAVECKRLCRSSFIVPRCFWHVPDNFAHTLA